MSFNKEKFAELLKLAKGDRSINQYALHSGVSSAHISRLMRMLLDTPPNPETIKLLADKAHNDITYKKLMVAAGHLDETYSDNIIETNNEFSSLKTLSQRLQKHRQLQELSIEELAEKIGLKSLTIERFENGEGGVPGQKTLDKLASVLGVTRDYLLGYTNDPKGYGVGTYDTDPKNLKEFIENNRSLGFDGDELELDEEEQEELLRHTRLAWMMIKEKRQEKAKKKK